MNIHYYKTIPHFVPRRTREDWVWTTYYIAAMLSLCDVTLLSWNTKKWGERCEEPIILDSKRALNGVKSGAAAAHGNQDQDQVANDKKHFGFITLINSTTI